MSAAGAHDAGWLARFHAGEVAVLRACYDDHFAAVAGAVAALPDSVDREAVVQDVFARLFTEPAFRARFTGGSLGAWLTTVARNRAIDVQRKQQRAVPVEPQQLEQLAGAAPDWEARSAARRAVERFKRERLPAKWQPVFEARFVAQLSQREAAAQLGLRRTTLAYQELRIRALLRAFLLGEEEAP